MKTTYLIVFFLLFILQSFAQLNSHHKNFNKSKETIKGYDIVTFTGEYYIDSTVLIQSLIIRENAKNKYIYLVSEYNSELDSLVTKRYKMTQEELHESCFFKSENQIYRLRSVLSFKLQQSKNDQINYFKEKLTDTGFEISKTPFMTGLSSDGFCLIREVTKINNKYVLIGVKTSIEGIHPMTISSVKEITFFTIESEKFELLSKKSYQVAEERLAYRSSFRHLIINNQLIVYYASFDRNNKDYWKINIISTNGAESNELVYQYNNGKIKNCVIFDNNKKLNLYILSALNEKKWQSSLLSIDLLNSKISEVSNQEINEASTNNPEKAYDFAYFSNYDLIKENNEVYIANYTNYQGQSWDFIVSKLSSNNIVWNNYILRRIRVFNYDKKGNIISYHSPILYKINNEEIILNDLYKKTKIEYHFNKESGECTIK